MPCGEGVEFDTWTLFTDEGLVLVHQDCFIWTDGVPVAQFHVAERATLSGHRLGFFRLNRKVELAVIQHLGPQAAIDQLTDVLDKHAVFVLRHRPSSLSRVDVDVQFRRRDCGVSLGCSACECTGQHESGCCDDDGSILHPNTPR